MGNRYDFSLVDWRERDTDITRQIGCTKELVRLKRKALGLPRAVRHSQPSRMTNFHDAVRWLHMHRHETPELTKQECVRLGQVSLEAITWASDYLGDIVFARSRLIPMCLVLPINWDLPSRDISRIWQKYPNWASCQHARHELPYARWDRHYPSHRNDPEYLAAIADEERKASEWFDNGHSRSGAA